MAYIHIPSFTKKGSFTNDTEFVIVVDGVEYLISYKTLSDTFGNTPELLAQLKAEIEALRAIVDAFPSENPAAPIALKIADTPTIDGIYKPTETGVYPNAGGLEYDPTEGITYFIRTQGVWTKDVTPINFTPTGLVEEGNTEAVSGGEVYKVINPFTVINHQLFDNSTMISGYYLSTGIYNDIPVSWICTPLIPIDSNETDITGSGFANFSGASVRFCFFNQERQFISSVLAVNQSTAPHTVPIPVGAKFVALNVANVVNIGLDPTNSAYATTFMLNYGDVALPWEEYGLAIDGTQIIGVQPELQENIDNLENLKEQFESVTVPNNQLFDNNTMLTGNYNNSGVFQPSNLNWICTPLIPLETGESEITVNGYGGLQNTAGRFFFYGESGFISNVLSKVASDTTPHTVLIPAGSKFVALNVANAVGIGTDPTNSPYATTLMLNYGSEALPWEEYNLQAVFLNGAKIKNLDLSVNPIQFVRYNALQKSFKHYQKDVKNDNIYYMFEVALYSTLGNAIDPIVYSNQWELKSAKMCTYNAVSGTMAEGLDLIAPGESEFVFMYTGVNGIKADHTGGVHGDERIDIDPKSFFIPFIDGLPYTNLNTDIPLKPCISFRYAQRSTLHDTAEIIVNKTTSLPAVGSGILSINSSTKRFEIDGLDTGLIAWAQSGYLNSTSGLTVGQSGGFWTISKVTTVIDGHPIIGEHFKQTFFINQGYRTVNTLELNSVRPVEYWYHGICCLSKNASKFGYNEDFEIVEFTGSLNSYLLSDLNRDFFAYNPTTGLSSTVASKIILDGNNVKDLENASMFVWDRVLDSKYYRKSDSFIPVINQKQTSEMTVKYNYKST